MVTTTAEANKELVRRYFGAWDDGDVDAIVDCFAEGFSTTYTGQDGEAVDVEPSDVPEWVAGWLDVISDMNHEIHEMVAEGDRVMARIRYDGIHDGEVFGVEPTGNRVSVREYLFFHVEDGEIVEFDWLGDDLALLRQLGVSLPIDP